MCYLPRLRGNGVIFFLDNNCSSWNTGRMRGERVSWIDICRGIGIVLVIYGHGLSGDSYRYIIYAFHMPLFFFLSGVVFHHRKYEHFFTFLKKSIKGVLIPYFMYAFITFGIALLHAKNPFSDAAFRQFLGIFYGNGATGGLGFNVVLWFLPCLFITRLIFAIITEHVNKKTAIIFFLFLFSVLGYLYALYLPTAKLPFGIETALTAVVFFGIGYLWNARSDKTNILFSKYLWILFGIFIINLVLFATLNYSLHNQQIDMRLNKFSNYVYFYLAAFSGIFSTIAGSMLIGKNKIIEYIGKHSLVLFIWHLLIFSYFSKLLRLFIDEKTIRLLRDDYLSPLYTLFSILVILLAVICIKRIKTIILPAKNKIA